MKLKKKYKEFDTVILRRPLYPLSAYHSIPKKEEEIVVFVQNLFNNPMFKEGVYLASPELYYEWEKAMSNIDYPYHKKQHLCKSILKYYIRSITNCVPFGLFASYTILNRTKTNIEIKPSELYTRIADVNISFLSSVINQLQQHEKVQKKLTYKVNDTAYTSGTSYRYVESFKNDSGERSFMLSDLDSDSVLQLIISNCKTSLKTKSELVQIILDSVEDVTLSEVKIYVNELIRSQIIISSLDFCLNGESPFKQIQNFIKDNFDNTWLDDNFLNSIVFIFNDIEKCIQQLNDYANGNSIPLYESLFKRINNSTIENPKKNFINTDLKRVPLSKDFTQVLPKGDKSLQEAIRLMTILATRKPEKKYTSFKNLETFRKTFIERYEEEEVLLLQVLDKETGISYLQNDYDNSSSSWLIDDLEFPNSKSDFEDVTSDLVLDQFWFKLIVKAIKDNKASIDLKNEDLRAFENRKPSLIGTFPMVYTSVGDKIFITSAGGSTALHYLGRFTSNDKELSQFGEEISEVENDLFPEKILAEISHLATYKAGNIAMRKVNRQYEIPVLAKASEKPIQIDLDDLLISVRGKEIILKSKKHNKEVIPFLSCAQNFHYGTIPIYHFLCDLQSQYRSNLLSIDINSLILSNLNFIPRIEYDNKLVLFLARWQFTASECKSFIDSNSTIIFEAFQAFKENHQIPRYICLSEKGSEPLMLDTNNKFMVTLISDRLKKQGKIYFTESMYDFSNCNNQMSANEYIISFKGDALVSQDRTSVVHDIKKNKKKYIPGDEWLYFKLYTGVNIADKILIIAIKETVDTLLKKELIDKWFFIRYNDPKFHLRIRFHFTDSDNKNKIIDILNQKIRPFVDNKSISKIELSYPSDKVRLILFIIPW